MLGDPQNALELYLQSHDVFQQIGYSNYDAIVVSNIGLAYEMLGDYQKALDYHGQALALSRAGGSCTAEPSRSTRSVRLMKSSMIFRKR